MIDFGIARTVDGATTFTGGIVGTPSYMAPEQFEDRAIGPAADVFAWGCVIAFAATGSSPFGGGSVAAISNRILRAEPDLGGLTGPLRDLVAACLAKDERARPSMRDLLLWLLGRPDAARAPIGEALAAGRRTAVSAAPPNPSTAAFQTGTVPVRGRSPLRGALIGAGAVAAAAVIITAVSLWPSGRGGTADHTSSPTASAAANLGELARTPRLGLEFWQNGAPDAMTFGRHGTNDVVTVAMKPAPFELRFPKQPRDVAIEVCAWVDDSIFNLQDGSSLSADPRFAPGTGLADYEYGSGTLYLNNEGHNHFVDTRIAAQSATEDKVIAQTWRGQQSSPLQRQRGDLYLTVFIDKNKDGKSSLTGPTEYEFVILHF